MPSTSGTSIQGLQLVNTQPAVSGRFLNLYVPTLETNERLLRIGTVLLCFRLANGHLPTMGVWKLYGNGLAIRLDEEVPLVAAEVWVRWFQSNIGWQCITPG